MKLQGALPQRKAHRNRGLKEWRLSSTARVDEDIQCGAHHSCGCGGCGGCSNCGGGGDGSVSSNRNASRRIVVQG